MVSWGNTLDYRRRTLSRPPFFQGLPRGASATWQAPTHILARSATSLSTAQTFPPLPFPIAVSRPLPHTRSLLHLHSPPPTRLFLRPPSPSHFLLAARAATLQLHSPTPSRVCLCCTSMQFPDTHTHAPSFFLPSFTSYSLRVLTSLFPLRVFLLTILGLIDPLHPSRPRCVVWSCSSLAASFPPRPTPASCSPSLRLLPTRTRRHTHAQALASNADSFFPFFGFFHLWPTANSSLRLSARVHSFRLTSSLTPLSPPSPHVSSALPPWRDDREGARGRRADAALFLFSPFSSLCHGLVLSLSSAGSGRGRGEGTSRKTSKRTKKRLQRATRKRRALPPPSDDCTA